MTPEEYAKRLWDWTPLNACFPRSIRLTDVDGAVEIGGEFLEIEGKPPGGKIPDGQAYYLWRKVAKGIRVVILEGTPPREVVGWRVLHNRRKSLWPGGGWTFRPYPGNYDDFVRFVRRWALLASGKRNRR